MEKQNSSPLFFHEKPNKTCTYGIKQFPNSTQWKTKWRVTYLNILHHFKEESNKYSIPQVQVQLNSIQTIQMLAPFNMFMYTDIITHVQNKIVIATSMSPTPNIPITVIQKMK